jgi:diguanylate cyclase
MQLDIPTLLVLATANICAVTAVSPLLMGRHPSGASRCVQLGLLAHGLGGIAATSHLAAGAPWLAWLGPVAVFLFGLGQVLLHRALGSWLGHRASMAKPSKPVRRKKLQDWLNYRRSTWCLQVLLVAAPLLYLLDPIGGLLCLAAMLLLVAWTTLFPQRKTNPGWRWLLCFCLASLALLLLQQAMQPPLGQAVAIAVNLAGSGSAMALLAAWRDEAKARMHTLAMTDGLTGLLNRRGWQERAEGMFANAQRYQLPLTMMMLDLDHFKHINDTYGHEVGDKALKLFARLLRETRRTGDLVGRLGGEEFCVVLANARRSASEGFDLRLRSTLRQISEKELGFAVNFSTGVAVMRDGDTTLTGLLARADVALYTAKHEGRGRLVQSEGGLGQTVI